MNRMDAPGGGHEHAGVRRIPLAARLALWLAISLVGLFVSLQVIFIVGDAARPLIGPIADDSVKEKILVAATYAVWFGLSALVSVLAWRILLRR